eukprot:gene3944-15275_t
MRDAGHGSTGLQAQTLHIHGNTRSVVESENVKNRYDTHCWVGVTIEVRSENKDVAIKFLHPHLPCVSFMWPRRVDVCWVPTSNILKKVQPPKPSTMTGRQYTFEPKDALEIEL